MAPTPFQSTARQPAPKHSPPSPHSTGDKTPPAFITKERNEIELKTISAFEKRLFLNCPEPPLSKSPWEDKIVNEAKMLLRCPKTRLNHLPKLPPLLNTLLAPLTPMHEQIELMLDHLRQHQQLNRQVLQLASAPYFRRQSRFWEEHKDEHPKAPLEQSLNHFRCLIALALLKPLYLDGTHCFRPFAKRLWHYAQLSGIVSQQLSTSLPRYFPCFVLSLLQSVGMLTTLHYTLRQLRRRPDIAKQALWVCYSLAREHGDQLSYWAAKDWRLPHDMITALHLLSVETQSIRHPSYHPHTEDSAAPCPLYDALSKVSLASKICYLFHYDDIDKATAMHWLNQWQLPPSLLMCFSQQHPGRTPQTKAPQTKAKKPAHQQPLKVPQSETPKPEGPESTQFHRH